MAPEQLRALQAAILASPACAPYVVTPEMGKVEGGAYVQDKAIAEIISADPERTRYVTTRLTSLGLAAKFPAIGELPGPIASEYVLQKIEVFATAAAQSEQLAVKLFGAQIKRQMVHLAGDVGMDFGDPAMHAMFDRMVQAAGITEEEAGALKGVSARPDPVTADDVSRALRGPWGDA
jgi:hypothetical protein